MPSLSDFGLSPIPATFAQADERIQGGQLRTNRALDRALATRTFKDRTVPGIINNAASRGTFYWGNTSRDVGRAAEDFMNQQSMAEYQTGIGLADILRNQFLIGLGVRV